MGCKPISDNATRLYSKGEYPGYSLATGLPDRSEAQHRRLELFGVAESIDLHCHCLPDVDDGPKTMDESLDLCRALVEDGITIVVATPHQLGRYEGQNNPIEIRQKVHQLNEQLISQHISLRVVPGGDIRIDERIVKLVTEDRILTLAETGKYLLLELPTHVPIDPTPLLQAIRRGGIEAILTHPERYPYLDKNPDHIHQWVREGLLLQITAGSLLGHFGSKAQRLSWRWLDEGVVSLIATDAHNTTNRRPIMSEAISAILQRFGARVASILCLKNPLAVFLGQPIRPITGDQAYVEQK